MGWRFILSLGFSIIIALFAIANAGSVRVNFIFAIYEVSQAIVILISAIVGAVIVMLLSIVKNIKLNMKISNQEKVIAELQREKEKNITQFAELEKKYEELFTDIEPEVPQIEEPAISETDKI
ncbi:MAG: LapA family protein [Eubacteriales bacterium]|nr:LapA family protein [Eubacteriales bacterium]